jgi:hypothetical protein
MKVLLGKTALVAPVTFFLKTTDERREDYSLSPESASNAQA